MTAFGPRPKKIKKISPKRVSAFWKEFADRAELYFDILAEGDEESDDYLWLCGMVGKALLRCAPCGVMPPAFHFDLQREPVRLVFEHRGDAYLLAAGEALAAQFPPALQGRLSFCVAES